MTIASSEALISVFRLSKPARIDGEEETAVLISDSVLLWVVMLVDKSLTEVSRPVRSIFSGKAAGVEAKVLISVRRLS